MDNLGYDSIEDLHSKLMALQVDGTAFVIETIKQKKSIIIAEQTGTGKGRQAAGVIRYALRSVKVPIFITQKPNLFSDMYADLDEIGWNSIVTQALGLSSESLRDTYEHRGRHFTNNKVVSQRRSTLIRLIATDILTSKLLDSALAKIQKFNEQHPTSAINGDTISRHLQAKQGRDAQTIDGVYYPKKRMGEAGQDKYYGN
jgi:isocitrate dehydrogenase